MKVALACSHGGHYTEMVRLWPAFADHDVFFVTYASSRSEEVQQRARAYFMPNIGTNPLRLVLSFPRFWRIYREERPDVVITTGAEIGFAAILVGRWFGAHTIYIESWCRTRSKSLTGRLVYPFAHEFLVQWPEMLRLYGSKARFHGGVA